MSWSSDYLALARLHYRSAFHTTNKAHRRDLRSSTVSRETSTSARRMTAPLLGESPRQQSDSYEDKDDNGARTLQFENLQAAQQGSSAPTHDACDALVRS